MIEASVRLLDPHTRIIECRLLGPELELPADEVRTRWGLDLPGPTVRLHRIAAELLEHAPALVALHRLGLVKAGPEEGGLTVLYAEGRCRREWVSLRVANSEVVDWESATREPRR